MEFFDNESARAGTLRLTLSEAGAPADGSHYELWAGDGLVVVSLGEIELGGGTQFTVDSDESILANFSFVFVTTEPDGQDSDEPTGDPIFVGIMPDDSLEQVRLIVISAPETPEEKGYLAGAEEQAMLAIDHGGFLSESLGVGDMNTARQHAEHVVNILSGEASERFGDLDNDGFAQNPGDGFGVLTYLERASAHAQMAATADGVTQEVTLHSGHTVIGIDNAVAYAEEAIQAAGRVLASDTVDEAEQAEEILNNSLDALLNGRDDNGDGLVAPIPGEGGILIAYEHALKMGSFEFFSAQDVSTTVQ
jgi:hypothetical protein